MALSNSVTESLDEAAGSLRNALAYAARNERAIVCTQISRLINDIENLKSFDNIMDKMEQMPFGLGEK